MQPLSNLTPHKAKQPLRILHDSHTFVFAISHLGISTQMTLKFTIFPYILQRLILIL